MDKRVKHIYMAMMQGYDFIIIESEVTMWVSKDGVGGMLKDLING
jgi:hypothetical protein